MNEQITISGPEQKAGSKLERILAEPVLSVTGGFGMGPGSRVVAPQQMQQICRLQFNGLVGNPVCIHHERKLDARLFAKQSCIIHIAQAHRGEGSSRVFELIFAFAQLRDMLAAEDSTVVAKKHQHGGTGLPQRTEVNLLAARFWQDDICQPRAEGFGA